MKNITWKIEEIKSIDGLLISEASWICIAQNETQKSHICGTTFFQNQTNKCFVCDNLTEENVIKWCFDNGLNKEEVENQVMQKLNNNQKPKTIGLPWI